MVNLSVLVLSPGDFSTLLIFEAGDSVVKQRRRENADEVQKNLKPISQGTIFKTNQGYYNIMVLPFILHLGFLTFTAFFVMHVQVRPLFTLSLYLGFLAFTSIYQLFLYIII